MSKTNHETMQPEAQAGKGLKLDSQAEQRAVGS